jgi:hypothetical protein
MNFQSFLPFIVPPLLSSLVFVATAFLLNFHKAMNLPGGGVAAAVIFCALLLNIKNIWVIMGAVLAALVGHFLTAYVCVGLLGLK